MKSIIRNRRNAFTLLELVVAISILVGVIALVWRGFLNGSRSSVGTMKLADFLQAEATIRSRLEPDLSCLMVTPEAPVPDVEPGRLAFKRMDLTNAANQPLKTMDVTYTSDKTKDGTYDFRRNGTVIVESGLEYPPFATQSIQIVTLVWAHFQFHGMMGTGSGAGYSFRILKGIVHKDQASKQRASSELAGFFPKGLPKVPGFAGFPGAGGDAPSPSGNTLPVMAMSGEVD